MSQKYIPQCSDGFFRSDFAQLRYLEVKTVVIYHYMVAFSFMISTSASYDIGADYFPRSHWDVTDYQWFLLHLILMFLQRSQLFTTFSMSMLMESQYIVGLALSFIFSHPL